MVQSLAITATELQNKVNGKQRWLMGIYNPPPASPLFRFPLSFTIQYSLFLVHYSSSSLSTLHSALFTLFLLFPQSLYPFHRFLIGGIEKQGALIVLNSEVLLAGLFVGAAYPEKGVGIGIGYGNGGFEDF
jgi:hypothetical protein